MLFENYNLTLRSRTKSPMYINVLTALILNFESKFKQIPNKWVDEVSRVRFECLVDLIQLIRGIFFDTLPPPSALEFI